MIIEAPAKINLTLEVTGVEQNGYHTLDTLFVWLRLHDTLRLNQAEQTSLTIEADGVDTALVLTDESNLVLRALRALEKCCGRALPTEMHLTKRIPAGGGLGGGSADAAAALVGLRRLHGLGVEDHELHRLAAKLGADVAFGLRGGFARGRRYGDELEALELPSDLESRTLLLLAPGFPCPTPEVYKAWDSRPSTRASGASERFLQAGPEGRLRQIGNDLQAPAETLFPQLVDLRQSLAATGLEAVCLSGSGSTLFGFLPDGASQDEVEGKLRGLGKVMWTKLRGSGRG